MYQDTYVIESLLQATKTKTIVWEGGAVYRTRIHENAENEVRLTMARLPVMGSGSLLFLTLSCRKLLRAGMADRAEISEPQYSGYFGKKYASEEKKRLAELLKELEAAVHRQIRERSGSGDEEQVKQDIYRQIFEAPPEES